LRKDFFGYQRLILALEANIELLLILNQSMPIEENKNSLGKVKFISDGDIQLLFESIRKPRNFI